MLWLRRLVMRVAHWGLLRVWWLTRPVVLSVRIMLVEDGQVLMLKHTYMPTWFFPGGLVDRGETVLEAAKREAFEEVGATCHSDPRLLGIFVGDDTLQTHQIALFVCEDFSWNQQVDDHWEIEAVSMFPLTDLPSDVWDGTKRRVDAYLNGDPVSAGMW